MSDNERSEGKQEKGTRSETRERGSRAEQQDAAPDATAAGGPGGGVSSAGGGTAAFARNDGSAAGAGGVPVGDGSGQRMAHSVTGAMQSAGTVGGGAVNVTHDVLRNAIGATADVGSGLVGGVTMLASDVVHGVRDVGREVGGVVRDGAQGVVGVVGEVGTTAVDTLTALMLHMVGGIRLVASAAVGRRGNGSLRDIDIRQLGEQERAGTSRTTYAGAAESDEQQMRGAFPATSQRQAPEKTQTTH